MNLPMAEITQEEFRLLSREIGLANTVRFINQFAAGKGNYTEDRKDTFAGMTMEDIVSEIRRRRPDQR